MSLIESIRKLYAEKRELALLEWTYLAMIILSVIVAGIFALFNHSLGQATEQHEKLKNSGKKWWQNIKNGNKVTAQRSVG